MTRERAAKAICHSCTVSQECLDYALRIREPHGIWGGRNEMERKHMIDRIDATIRTHAQSA